MDFKAERDNHLGSFGGIDDQDGGNYVYLHDSFGRKKGDIVELSLSFKDLIQGIKQQAENNL